ncbi:MAG: homocysteine S-methyltransferase family protein [Pseudomonadota bacterium]
MIDQILTLIAKQTLLLDGGMGTMIQAANLGPEAYQGLPVCSEVLNLTNPKIIEEIHCAYLKAGADLILTNTFGASLITLSDHNIAAKAAEINLAAVRIAKAAVAKFYTAQKPRFVVGELGPTSKLPTLGQISFAELFEAYLQQVNIFLDQEVDALIITTSQDPLQAKAAAAACQKAMLQKAKQVPLLVSFTVEANGKMLLGTDIIAAYASLAPFKPAAFGLNCATGPAQMSEHLRALAQVWSGPLLCKPNAGLPETIDGKLAYSLGPEEFAAQVGKLMSETGISLIGGCCGTNPEYIKALQNIQKQDAVRRAPYAIRSYASSLFSAVSLEQEPRPFIIAEQTNVNGSKNFRDLLLQDNYDGMVQVAKKAALGAHALDICVATAQRDEIKDMQELVSRLVKTVDAPLMIDSLKPEVIEAALALAPGRCLINSINLEDGGIKARRILELACKYGAAVVCLTIDEQGMAKTAEKKVAIAKKLHDLALSYNLTTADLLFDLLTFTVASGDKTLLDASLQTIAAITKLKKEIPQVNILLGVSNISYGLPLVARKIINSCFLHQTTQAGLDAAIINPLRIISLEQISAQEKRLAENLLNNDASQGDPLTNLVLFYDKKDNPDQNQTKIQREKLSPIEILQEKIKQGDKTDLEPHLTELTKQQSAASVINEVLLPAMKQVGELMAKGQMPLPFVLQAAEVMRAAIDILTPQLEQDQVSTKGKIVLATVRGDVHDIGKNLVDIIFSNNGYEVINLGIRQPVNAILEAVQKYQADAIGLSGLLVSSVQAMQEDLEVMRNQGYNLPVLVGGAALTRQTTEMLLQKVYNGKVYYCADVFAGLKAMERILAQET